MIKIIARSGIFSVLGECLENVELKTSYKINIIGTGSLWVRTEKSFGLHTLSHLKGTTQQ